MPTIIAATDFSPIGDHAVHYAAGLASHLNYPLTILHTYIMPVYFDDPMQVAPIVSMGQGLEERMDSLRTQVQFNFPTLILTTEVVYGNIKDCLNEKNTAKNPHFAVIGGHGGEDKDMWMGGATIELLRNITYPVLAVPPHIDFKPVRNICLACDFKELKEQHILDFFQSFLANRMPDLHLLHVDQEGESQYGSDENHPHPHPSWLEDSTLKVHYTTTAGSVDEKIAAFSEENGMDWVAVIPHHYSFWESLFHKSHTKGLARISHLPVLALHVPVSAA